MNTAMETINAAGRAFVDFSLPMLIQSSVLILILLAVDAVLRRKVRAVFRYWIWMLVLVKLVLPPSLGSPVSVGTWLGDKLEVPSALLFEPESSQPAEPQGTELSPVVSDMIVQSVVLPRASVPTPVEVQPGVVVRPPAVSLSWRGFVLLVWSAVVIALTLLLVQRAFFVRGLVAQAQDAHRGLLDELEDCCRRLGLRRRIDLRLSPNATSPAVCGLLHPTILVPQSLAPRLHAHDLQAVLLHELAHVKRGDLWINLVQTLLQIIYFYNPLLWLANAMIRRTREQAVDEAVLVAMGETARQYPETLVNIAKLAFQRRPALSLRLIGVVESKSALAARIKHILSRPLPKTASLGVIGLLTIVVIAAVLLPMAKARQNEIDEPLSRLAVLPNCGVWTSDINGQDLPVLDLASERILVLPDVKKEYDLVSTTETRGEGDILYYFDAVKNAAKITFLRRAGLGGEPPSNEYESVTITPMEIPFKTTVATRGGGKFNIEIIRADEEACSIRFQPLKDSRPAFKAIWAEGITAELLGVCESTSERKKWWRSDGSPLPEAPCPERGASSLHPSGGEAAYEVAVRVSHGNRGGLAGIFIPSWQNESDIGIDHGAEHDLGWGAGIFPKSQGSCSVRCHVMTGPWETTARVFPKVLGSQRMTINGVTFCEAGEDPNEGATVTAFYDFPNRHCAIRAVARDGRVVEATRQNSGGYGGRDALWSTVHFRGLPLAEIAEFQFQKRPGTWVEFENVSLQPGHKTDVRITVVSEEIGDTAPEGMVGTWRLENSEGHDEQMAVFPDGRVVISCSDGRDEQTQYSNGFVTLAHHGRTRAQMMLGSDGTILQYFGGAGANVFARRWRRVAVQPTAGAITREIVLPDVDHKAVMLDLATGQLVPTPQVEPPERLLETIKELGKGDLVLDQQSLILVRGATSKQAQEGPEGLVKIIKIGSPLPQIVTVTTSEGRRYEVTILSADENGCTLKYSPVPADRGAGGGVPVEPEKAAGILEFRIAAKPGDMNSAAAERYQHVLVNGLRRPEDDFAWFPSRAGMTGSPEVPAQEHGGTAYVLLRNKPPHAILASQDWGLDKVYRTSDAADRPAIGLTLNEKGASLFRDITTANVGRPLAILVAGEVVSMPHILSPLGRSAIIAGNFTEREVADMMAALRPAQKTTSDTTLLSVAPQAMSGRVVDPNGKPVAGAQVALCSKDKGVIVRAGRLVPTSRTDKSSEIVQTDAEGRFSFASAPEEFHLIAAHDEGFAWVTSEELRASTDLRLEPWARIEGTLKIGQTPGADERVELFNYINKNAIDQNVRFDYQSQTNAAGRFVFTKVPPSWIEVGYLIQTGDPSWTHTCRTPIHLEPGQNMQMTLGGQGRPVIGRFVPPADCRGSVYFGTGLRSFCTSRPEMPQPDNYDQMTQREQSEWLKQWLKIPEAQAYYDTMWHNLSRRHYAFRIQDDGRFRIEDVIPGNYEFTVWLEEEEGLSSGGPAEFGSYHGTVEVPPMAETYSAEPLDVGDLVLKIRPLLHVGDRAPLFVARTLDGKDIRLADYRGRFVLLAFWSPVFHPELARLKELHATYGGTGRLQIIGLGGTDTLDEVRKYVEEQRIEWPEIYFGPDWDAELLKQLGGQMQILLIDPEGRIAATWLREEKLTNTVRDAIAAADSAKSVSTSPSSIQQRIDAAAPGDTVRLEPGTYHERLRIDKPLMLEGAGWDKTTVVMESQVPESREQAADLAALSVVSVVGAPDVTIRGIKFTAPGRRIEGRSLPMAIVTFSHSEVRLSDCAVIGGIGDGVHIVNQSNAVLHRCLVAAVWGTGIRVGSKKDTAETRIEDSDIRNCHYAGICIARDSRATIERCRVSGAAWHGIRYDDASPVISGNLIFGSARSGIYASGQTQATIKRNLFYANEMGGMSCWFQDKDLIEGNTFSDNKGPGLAILGASKPSVRSNIFYGHPAGVSIGDVADDSPFAKSDGSASLENNLFWANERAIQRTSDTGAAEAVALDEKAGVAVDPRFAAPDAKDFSLKADSPTRQKGVGAVDLIPFASPWPLQPEELAIIPQGDSRDSRQWRDPPLPQL